MRKFQAVMWAGGGAVTPNLKEAANTGGVITRYVKPDDGATPGRFLLVAKDVVGVNSNLPFPFSAHGAGRFPHGLARVGP